MKHNEQEILDIIKDIELEPDMLDIWEDEYGNIIIEAVVLNQQTTNKKFIISVLLITLK